MTKCASNLRGTERVMGVKCVDTGFFESGVFWSWFCWCAYTNFFILGSMSFAYYLLNPRLQLPQFQPRLCTGIKCLFSKERNFLVF